MENCFTTSMKVREMRPTCFFFCLDKTFTFTGKASGVKGVTHSNDGSTRAEEETLAGRVWRKETKL